SSTSALVTDGAASSAITTSGRSFLMPRPVLLAATLRQSLKVNRLLPNVPEQIASLPQLPSLHASVAVPLNLFDLTRSYVNRERTIESHSTIPVFHRNAVMPRRQGNPEPALIVRCEGCNCEITLLYDKGSIRKRFRIGNALFHWPTRNAVQKNRSFETSSRRGRRHGLCLCLCNANKRSEQNQQ